MSLTTVKDLVVNLVSKAGTTYRVLVVVSLTTLIAGLRQYAKHLDAKHGQQTGAGTIVPAAKSNATAAKANKVAVDGRFFKRFMRLLKIMIPGPFSPEAGYMLLVAITMIGRTYCDVWMLTNGTAIERSIITRDRKSFLHHLSLFVLAMSPLAIITNLLKYGLNELKLRFRTRLTNHLYKSYMQGFTFYQVSNLDNRITNADQLLTQDVEKFCTSVSDLYSNVSKPLLDMVVYARALSTSIGAMGPLQMLGYLVFSGFLLTNLRKPTGRYTVQEQQLEGEFRFVNSRLITSSEEVAFYNGNKREQVIIDSAFKRLTRHLRQSIQFRGLIGYIDSIIAKYFATVVGFLVLSRPYLSLTAPTLPDSDNSEVMEDYYRNGRMLVNLAKAMGRLVLAGRELTRLAGFTSRVDELDTVLRDLHKGKYERTMVSNQEGAAGIEQEKLVPNSGKIIEMDRLIRFDNVPLVTPNGDVLIRRMNFEVQAGMNVLVAGPNGCGKSSLFRILGGLWPLFGGTLVKPKTSQLFYVPQRPYLTLGTLRDQVIYPHSVEEMHAAGTTDADLLQLLSHVQLQYLAQRPGGWDAIEDWADVLSGGEKQRVAMARLFYHKPQFAILDECTSAVSVDVEGFMYTYCRETLKISLFTVSHRQSLWKYHDYVLQFSGRGEYEFKKIDNSTPVYGS